MQTTTIRPGLLVSLKTSVTGNVTYRKQDLDASQLADGAQVARWETERTIADPVELEAASKVRSKARTLISALCAHSSFGLLCPLDDAPRLQGAIQEAQQLANEFNARAGMTRVAVYVIAGKVAADDVQATAAINSEVRDLLDRMAAGVRALDAEAIRDAASRAKALGQMIAPGASERLQKAIDIARSAARKIVKAGEAAATEVDAAAVRAIAESRTAFLDMDDQGEIEAPAETARAIDMDPATPAPIVAAPVPQFALDL